MDATKDVIKYYLSAPRIETTHTCIVCHTEKKKFEPKPLDPPDQQVDFRQWCWKCKQITQHQKKYK